MNALPEIPSSLRKLMENVGPIWAEDTRRHILLMMREFSKVLAAAPKDGVFLDEAIPYGTHEHQKFDVYRPLTGEGRRPALIFVPGGTFTEGSRHRTKEIYANVLYYFANKGIVGINAGYRLAPEVRYPEATRDIASVVQWTVDHADELGIDPGQVFLMGHSAGAAHVASYAYDKRHRATGHPPVAGVLIISGRVRADTRPDNPAAQRVAQYYGSDITKHYEASPVSHVDASSPKTLIATAEYENPLIDVYCAELAYRLSVAKGYAPPFYWLKGHNHGSLIGQFNTAEELLPQACCDFIYNPR